MICLIFKAFRLTLLLFSIYFRIFFFQIQNVNRFVLLSKEDREAIAAHLKPKKNFFQFNCSISSIQIHKRFGLFHQYNQSSNFSLSFSSHRPPNRWNFDLIYMSILKKYSISNRYLRKFVIFFKVVNVDFLCHFDFFLIPHCNHLFISQSIYRKIEHWRCIFLYSSVFKRRIFI